MSGRVRRSGGAEGRRLREFGFGVFDTEAQRHGGTENGKGAFDAKDTSELQALDFHTS